MRAGSASCTKRSAAQRRAVQRSAAQRAVRSGRTEALSNIDDRIRRRTRKTLIEELLRRGGQHAFWDELTDREACKRDQQAPGLASS